MSLKNTRAGYGWAAIVLHWLSAGGMLALYLLGEAAEESEGAAAKLAALDLHVSVGMLLFAFLAARVLWSVSQPRPSPVETMPLFRVAASIVQSLFLVMIVALLMTGPLAVWSEARPVEVFGGFALASPFATPVEWLHDATKAVHGAAGSLFWPLIALHVAGAMKHQFIDRDATLQRMLWVRRA